MFQKHMLTNCVYASQNKVQGLFTFSICLNITAVQPVFNPFSQFVPQLELYSQL